MKPKYKKGDILNVRPSHTDEEKHERSSLFTKYHISEIKDKCYQGYYSIPSFPGKEFSMILSIIQLDNDPDYKLSIKEKLKNL